MASDDEVPSGTWRFLGCAAVTLLFVAIGGIGLISAGTFDPKINGELQSRLTLFRQDVPAQSHTLRWLDLAAPDQDYTVRMRARFSEGEADIGYGLTLGAGEGYVLVALSPLGYLTVRDQGDANAANSSVSSQGDSERPNLPWQTWPHVRTGEQSNEIWINVNNGTISEVRINGEMLHMQDLPLEGTGIGLWAESYGGPASIEFLELELFYKNAK
jgi:hypothetical protein